MDACEVATFLANELFMQQVFFFVGRKLIFFFKFNFDFLIIFLFFIVYSSYQWMAEFIVEYQL